MWIQADAHGTHSSLIAKVDARLAEKPEDGGLWFQRAMLEFEHEEYAAAAVDLEKAENFAPGKFAVLWWQGRILEAQGKFSEGKATLDRYLEKVPTHWGALASRARIQAKLGANAEALVDFRAALKHCQNVEPDLIAEVATALASNDCTDEAITVLEAGLQRIGTIPALQLKLLEIEVEADRYAAALSRLDAFEKSAHRREPWMEKRASILAQAGSIAGSQTAWRTLITHLNSLPTSERESHAMILLAERAHRALAVLPVSTSSQPSPFTNFSIPQNR